ncbi:selenium cofactor biosynthesis protein YqeC [Chloroflexota bacterium]
MKLLSALRINKTSKVAFVGSGGKTTALSQVAGEINSPCIISTTTHFGTWQTGIGNRHLIIQESNSWKDLLQIQKGSVLVTGSQTGSRFGGLNTSEINRCLEICEANKIPLFLECDGSRQLPLKSPKDNEPPIPQFIDTVVVCCGLSGLGKPLNSKTTYHPDLFSEISGIRNGQKITQEGLQKVLSSPYSGLKNIPKQARKVLLLNQADSQILQSIAGKVAAEVRFCFDSVIISSLLSGQVHAVFEPTAAIILAAGSSSRYGDVKQLLGFKGLSFLRSLIHKSVLAGLSPIVVVTGANHEQISDSIKDLRETITIIHNSNWELGQSTSIRAGLSVLEQAYSLDSRSSESNSAADVGSAIFLLADQPQVEISLLEALMDQHSRSLSPVIAPLVDGQRTNPILFDKVTFPLLKKLVGDIGGRGIFQTYPPEYIQWNDHSLLLDVDTHSDYSRLIDETR